jgi:hypothetical protein
MPLQEEEKYGSPTPLVFIFPLFSSVLPSFVPFFAVCHTEVSVLVQVVRTFSVYHWKKDQPYNERHKKTTKVSKLLHIHSSLKWLLQDTPEILEEQLATLSTHLQVGCTKNSTHGLLRS